MLTAYPEPLPGANSSPDVPPQPSTPQGPYASIRGLLFHPSTPSQHSPPTDLTSPPPEFDSPTSPPPCSILTSDIPTPFDPPPPYPSRERRTRRPRRVDGRRIVAASSESQANAEHDQSQPFPSDETSETTPLLAPRIPNSTRRSTRPRSTSFTSTVLSSSSAAPSLAQTVLSLFNREADIEDLSDPEDYETLPGEVPNSSGRVARSGNNRTCAPPDYQQQHQGRQVFCNRVWTRYFRPLWKRSYYSALFHLLVLNFPYALAAWIYLFVFTLTGTTLLIALPIGAILCFFDLLGARAFARGELALQTTFHGPLAYPPPYPPRSIFTRLHDSTPSDVESAGQSPRYEESFYKNTYAMFTDPTSYQAIFYFLVIKPGITLLLTLLLIVLVPVSFALVLPAPFVLRAVRRLGIWQANVAVEGLYYAVM